MEASNILNELVIGVKNNLSMGLTSKRCIARLIANGSPLVLAEKIVKIAELQIKGK